MFVRFLYELRQRKVPVGTHEAIALAQALQSGLHEDSLEGFYHVARSLLVHREAHLDAFDEAFGAHFRGIEAKSLRVSQELYEWLKEAKERRRELTEAERALLESIDLDELRQMFEERLNEQKERHDYGNRWIGTGGTSRFGRKGAPGEGIRVGGAGGNRSAVQVADARKYRGYRSDLTLDVRQMGVALRKLRAFVREGVPDELDLEGTIDATAQNAGELEVVTRPARRPDTRVVLMMDVGGSMDPYAQMVSRLFSAARAATHLKELRCYYFHNCVYGQVYRTERFDDPVPVSEVLADCGRHHKLIMVGDALMAPYELLYATGAISLQEENRMAGIAWLAALEDHFDRSVWLNPEPQAYWSGSTIDYVRQVFPMFPLTLDGLGEAMGHLTRGKSRRP